ncbi:MAG: class I SAM-dependent methyltransferase [Chitinophagaceae bacterium]|nr:MAG: class I SAM-dependent methyltransferase [Chitinophagaceae bacterium]
MISNRSILKKQLVRFLQFQSFQPGLLSLFLNPFYLIRRDLFRNIRETAPQLKGKLIDFGCGRKPYENLFSVDEYIGLDIEQTGHDHTNSKVDVYYDGKVIPFPAATFDSLFFSEVLEHIFNVEEVLSEIHRVLKPGAKALITVPFCWNEHEVPYDYGRYSSFGIKYLLEQNGFRIIEIRKSGHFARVVAQLSSLYFFETFKKLGKTGYALSMLFAVPIHITGLIASTILPTNRSLYFNNIIVAEKIGNG